MNLREIKELSSLKYEYKGSQKYDVPPLYLKGMFSKINSPRSEEPSIFIGFVNGKNNAQQLNVFFTNTDKVIIEKNKERFRNENTVYLNINHLSATRFPANISASLKKICVQYAKMYDKRMKIKELEDEERKERNKFNNLFSETNDVYRKEVDEDITQYTKKEHINKLLGIISNNTNLRWRSKSESSIYATTDVETRIDFGYLPDGFNGYREYDGQAMLDEPDEPTPIVIDYLKKLSNRSPKYSKMYRVFNEINSAIKKDKYKTFKVEFIVTFDVSGRNDETANLEYGFLFKFKDFSKSTYKEMDACIFKYKDLLNSIN